MTPSFRNRPTRLLPFAVAVLLALALAPRVISAAEGKCEAAARQFSCPNCGGIAVGDCRDCDGYLFTDYQHELCYDRKLFNGNAQDGDSDNHYPFLWYDL